MSDAIVLLSGGLDSATALGWASDRFDRILPVSIYYGQRHRRETFAAESICEHYQLETPRYLDFSQAFAMIGGSSLTSGRIDTNPSSEEVERTESLLPPTFVPGRNLVFISAAAALGYVEKIPNIVGGWNAVDYSGYPDCRPDFFESLEQTIAYALGLDLGQLRIHTPLITLTKAQIIKLGLSLNVPYQLTWSCYAGGDTPCGQCDSCSIRIAGFKAAGLDDPAL